MISAKYFMTKTVITLGVAIAVAITFTGAATRYVNGGWFKFKSVAKQTQSLQVESPLYQNIVIAQQPDAKTNAEASPQEGQPSEQPYQATAAPQGKKSKSGAQKRAQKKARGRAAKGIEKH